MLTYEILKCCATISIGYDISGLDLLSSLQLNRPGFPIFNHDLLDEGIEGNLPAVRLIIFEKKLGQGLYPFAFDVKKVPLDGPKDRTCTGKDRGALAGTKGEEVL
jgi:hypothetical protein